MPVLENKVVIELVRGVKAFVSLKAGVTRGELPDLDAPLNKAKAPSMPRQQNRTNGQQRIAPREKATSQPTEGPAQRGDSRASGNVVYDGVLLPPRNQRPCGANFKDDRFYLKRARSQANMLVQQLGLNKESSLLDVGSGPGRIAIGILDRVGEIRKYRGVDVDANSIWWGSTHITPEHPNFEFIHIDVESTRYNPEGAKFDGDFAFPFEDEEFDIITLYSVFTHMLTDGVRAYLHEFKRLLTPDGKVFVTAFLEEGVPDMVENPEGYLGYEWKGALHCVRYNVDFFEKLVDEAGLKLERLGEGTGKGPGQLGQRGAYLSRKN